MSHMRFYGVMGVTHLCLAPLQYHSVYIVHEIINVFLNVALNSSLQSMQSTSHLSTGNRDGGGGICHEERSSSDMGSNARPSDWKSISLRLIHTSDQLRVLCLKVKWRNITVHSYWGLIVRIESNMKWMIIRYNRLAVLAQLPTIGIFWARVLDFLLQVTESPVTSTTMGKYRLLLEKALFDTFVTALPSCCWNEVKLIPINHYKLFFPDESTQNVAWCTHTKTQVCFLYYYKTVNTQKAPSILWTVLPM